MGLCSVTTLSEVSNEGKLKRDPAEETGTLKYYIDNEAVQHRAFSQSAPAV